MSPGTFDVISLLSAAVSVYTIVQLVKRWRSFSDDVITEADYQLAGLVAFFLLIPVGVFCHEAGHALATKQLGGDVAEFQWRVFWGYVRPAGRFTDLEYWWIALAGNLVSVLLGLAAFPVARLARPPIVKVVAGLFGRYELVFALFLYPLMSFTGFDGDWRVIYDFAVRPWAQLTLAVHVALLGFLWWRSRQSEQKKLA